MPRNTAAVSALAVLAALAALAASSPIHLSAQTTMRAGDATLELGGRVQTQFRSSSVEGVPSDFFIRRARTRLKVRLTDRLDGRLDAEFSGGDAELRNAWLRLSVDPALRVSLGQFKRGFSVFELASSSDLPIIERDGRVDGLDACPAVDGVCTFSRLTQRLEFDGRDQGVRVEGILDGGVSYLLTATDGEGANTSDINDAKSFSGRVGFVRGVASVGAFAGAHDHLVGGESEYAFAGGVDLELGTWRDGLHILAAVATGEAWTLGPDARFTSAQGLATFYFAGDGELLDGVEPLLRLAWSDLGGVPDPAGASEGGLLVTPGVMLYLHGKNGIAANVDVYAPEGGGDAESSLKIQSFLYF